jgi:hypothetical protein
MAELTIQTTTTDLVEISDALKYKALQLALESLTGEQYPKNLLLLTFQGQSECDPSEKDANGNTPFECLCGKTNLIYLNHFTYDETLKDFIIGSKCINYFIADSSLPEEVKTHINNIWKQIKKEELKRKKTICWVCREHKISKNYEYKEDYKKVFCKDCVIKKWGKKCIPCEDCGTPREIKKAYYGKYMMKCLPCWAKDKDKKKNSWKTKY